MQSLKDDLFDYGYTNLQNHIETAIVYHKIM